MPSPDAHHAAIVDAFRLQAETADENGSPLVARLMAAALESLERDGPLRGRLADWQGHPVLDALPLRVLGAVHDRVLAGAHPELAALYAAAARTPAAASDDRLPAAFLAALERDAAFVRERCDQPVQTNEVRRSVALIGGFLRVAAETGLPLRLLEMGSSAGLNLCWDHYRFALGGRVLGPADAELTLDSDWQGPALPATAWPRVASREGCDLAPLDASRPADRRRLSSFVWPDQRERHERLARACAIAASVRPRVDRSPVLPWLEPRLAEPVPGVATVFFHSVVWMYLSDAERSGVTRALELAGERATPDAPLAWLRMEGLHPHWSELRLRRWPGGRDERLGWSRYHGQAVRWGSRPRPAS